MNLIILCRIIFILKFTGNQLYALTSTAENPQWVVDQVEELIKVLEKQIETLRHAALEQIEQHLGLNAFVFVTNIMGFTNASAIQILAELMM